MAGMKAKPIPNPRTSMARLSQTIDVWAPIRPKGIVATVTRVTPIRVSGPPP